MSGPLDALHRIALVALRDKYDDGDLSSDLAEIYAIAKTAIEAAHVEVPAPVEEYSPATVDNV